MLPRSLYPHPLEDFFTGVRFADKDVKNARSTAKKASFKAVFTFSSSSADGVKEDEALGDRHGPKRSRTAGIKCCGMTEKESRTNDV